MDNAVRRSGCFRILLFDAFEKLTAVLTFATAVAHLDVNQRMLPIIGAGYDLFGYFDCIRSHEVPRLTFKATLLESGLVC